MEKRPDFVGGAVVLTAAALVVKVLGALYKIPLGNLLDSQGMAHFHVAYNIYNFLLLLSTAGLPLALSRLVARAAALGRERQARRLFHVALGLFLVPGLGFGGVMWLCPEALARLLRDTQAAPAIRALGPAVLAVCLLAAFRGYTQGRGDMLPTAVSQIVEALGKLGLGLPLAWWLLRRGEGAALAAAGAIFGVSAGAVLALGILAAWQVLRWRPCRSGDVPQGCGQIARQLLGIGLPITLGAGGMSALTLLDQLLVMDTLQSALGFSEAKAAALYGEYTFSSCLFTLPAAFVTPLTVSLLPAITAALARNDRGRAASLTRRALALALWGSIPAGVGLRVLASPVLHFLFPAVPGTAEAAAGHLHVLALACPFVCLMLVTSGVLQAWGQERWPVWVLLLGGGVKIAVNRALVAQPAIGIRGAAVGTLCGYGFIALVQLALVRRLVRGHLLFSAWRPLVAAGGMGLVVRGFWPVLDAVCGSLAVPCAVALGAVFYLLACFLLGCLPPEVFRWVPEGEKIADFLKIGVTSP